jgi:hypothetical protein
VILVHGYIYGTWLTFVHGMVVGTFGTWYGTGMVHG